MNRYLEDITKWNKGEKYLFFKRKNLSLSLFFVWVCAFVVVFYFMFHTVQLPRAVITLSQGLFSFSCPASQKTGERHEVGWRHSQESWLELTKEYYLPRDIIHDVLPEGRL